MYLEFSRLSIAPHDIEHSGNFSYISDFCREVEERVVAIDTLIVVILIF